MQIYRQTAEFTCGPASILMILHHYFPKRFVLNRESELKLWQKSVRSPLKGTEIFALASILQKEGLKTMVYVGKIKYSSMFWKKYKELGVTKEDMDLATEITSFYYKDALEDGIVVKKTVLKFKDVDRFIRKSDFVILRTNIGILKKDKKNLSHYIVVAGTENSKYHVYDPYNGEAWLERKVLRKAFDTVKTLCGEDNRALTVCR